MLKLDLYPPSEGQSINWLHIIIVCVLYWPLTSDLCQETVWHVVLSAVLRCSGQEGEQQWECKTIFRERYMYTIITVDREIFVVKIFS